MEDSEAAEEAPAVFEVAVPEAIPVAVIVPAGCPAVALDLIPALPDTPPVASDLAPDPGGTVADAAPFWSSPF